MDKANSTTKKDGGYYAIKGFTYQFDKSLLEAINNKAQEVRIEQIQDIETEQYYIQVKHKEAQSYSPSKITNAVTQLIRDSIDAKTSRFILYCHFKDKSPEQRSLDLSVLNAVLGKNQGLFSDEDKKSFIERFTLEFSENFISQFEGLIKTIKEGFGLKSDEEAMVYHAIFRANLLEVAIRKDVKSRSIGFETLRALVTKNEKLIFELAYCNYLKTERYLAYLKKEYFTFKKVNIPNKERLFMIDIDTKIRDSEILDIINNIRQRYFKKNTSPAPYVVLLKIDEDREVLLKQKAWDKGLIFQDGTHFNGDKFRFSDIIADTHNIGPTAPTFKFLSNSHTTEFLKKKSLDEVFIFTTGSESQDFEIESFKKFYISQTKDIIKVIQ